EAYLVCILWGGERLAQQSPLPHPLPRPKAGGVSREVAAHERDPRRLRLPKLLEPRTPLRQPGLRPRFGSDGLMAVNERGTPRLDAPFTATLCDLAMGGPRRPDPRHHGSSRTFARKFHP